MSMLKQIAEDEHKMEMTPMIDVTFLLLIFFMCTIKFKTLEGKLSAYLPKDVGVNQSEADPKEKVDILIKVVQPGKRVNVNDNGEWREGDPNNPRFRLVGRKIEFKVGPKKFTDVDDLRKRLKVLHDDDPERPATIDARPGTVYADVVVALDAAIQAKFEEITFAGSYK